MAVSEKISAISDARFAFAVRAAVYCYEFAKRVFIPDFQIGRFAAIFQILRLLADGTVRIKPVFRPGIHRATKRDMMLQPAIRTKSYIGANHAVRSDDSSRAKLCTRIYNRS